MRFRTAGVGRDVVAGAWLGPAGTGPDPFADHRAVRAEVDRLRALPDVAAEDARVRASFAGTGPLSDANTYLETVAAHAGADDLFLIDAEGETNAASNWTRPSSFEGENYAFRPYFQNALAPGRGQFYAIGVTTSVPVCSLSARVVMDYQRGPFSAKPSGLLRNRQVGAVIGGSRRARLGFPEGSLWNGPPLPPRLW